MARLVHLGPVRDDCRGTEYRAMVRIQHWAVAWNISPRPYHARRPYCFGDVDTDLLAGEAVDERRGHLYTTRIAWPLPVVPPLGLAMLWRWSQTLTSKRRLNRSKMTTSSASHETVLDVPHLNRIS